MKSLRVKAEEIVSLYFDANSFIHKDLNNLYIESLNNHIFSVSQRVNEAHSLTNKGAYNDEKKLENLEAREEFTLNVDEPADCNRKSVLEMCNLVSDNFNSTYIVKSLASSEVNKTESVKMLRDHTLKNISEKDTESTGLSNLSTTPKLCKAKKFGLAGAKKIELKRKCAKTIITNEICSVESGSISGSKFLTHKNFEDQNLNAISKILQLKKSKVSRNHSIRMGLNTNSHNDLYQIAWSSTSKDEIKEVGQDFNCASTFINSLENTKSYLGNTYSKTQVTTENEFSFDKHSDSYYNIIKSEIKAIKG